MIADNPNEVEKLLKAGWIVMRGNQFYITEAGKKALYGSKHQPFGPTLPIDAVRQRSRPPNKKKKHRP